MQSRITDFDCERMLDELSTCQAPFLIGVRHHSAAMARIIPQLLDEFQPERILLELPGEFSEWLPWLSHKETQGPVALAGCRDDGGDLFFYPFVDFSPEMAAIRWASAHGVPVDAFDLPIDERVPGLSRNHEEQPGEVDSPSEDAGPDRYHEATLSGAAPNSDRDLLQKLMDRHEVTDTGQLWDRLVESPAVTSAPEQIRRAGLLFGWATRWSNGPPSEYDRLREAWMRSCIQMAGEQRCAAVIGAFHAAALLPIPKLWTSRAGDPSINSKTAQSTSDRKGKIATSLIPYTFEQLDERSGYPAGIRDPMWHQRVFEAGSIEDIDHAAVDLIVGVCRELRNSGHPMNAADAKEVVRISRDLARVRRLKTPGRQEVVEAMQLCLTQGQLYGAGRAVAAALQTVFVGSRMGQLPADMPRCGLAPHIEQILKTLNLPGPESITQEKRMRLDPLRSALDRAREVVFRQLLVCRIPYAEPEDDGGFGDRESLTTVWTLKWQNSTAAMISLSSARGTTLRQAAEGILRQSLLEPQSEWGMTQLETFSQAATCGLGELVRTGLDWIHGSFSDSATLPELTKAMSLIDPIRSGHIPGLPHPNAAFRTDFCQAFAVPQSVTTSALLQAALTRLDGLIGSEQVEDARALLDLVLWFQQQDAVVSTSLEASRLLWTLRQFMDAGSGLMHGTSAAALLILNQLKKEQFQSLTASWLDAATSSESRRLLSMRLTGMLPVALPRIQSDIECLAGIDERIDAFDDNEFLQRTPALRRGFQVLSPAARRGVLRQIQDLHPECDSRTISSSGSSEVLDPATQQMWFEADQAAGQMLLSLMPDLELSDDLTQMESQSDLTVIARQSHSQLNTLERWKLILGTPPDPQNRAACSAARALDEIYGQGSGEGARGGLSDRGGNEDAYPGVREWAEELEELFGSDIREEVLGEAIEGGRTAAITVLNEENVRPSIELLQTVLSMKGGLPDSQTEKLRRIARKITDQLARALANRMAPALTGLSTPRPTRRPSPRLDLRRTILANLHTARISDDGRAQLAPEKFYFRTPVRKSMDWHIVFVVDVSGSMEQSVIYSALTAAIFSALPAVSVSFLAFSTQVIDFTDHVEDPLGMLLEVQIGGGTHIWKGLRAAREKIRVPKRTLVLLVTDFEEGGSVGALLNEVRALVDTGAIPLGLAALSDEGKPRYHTGIAAQIVSCGMPVAALSPTELARWVGEKIR